MDPQELEEERASVNSILLTTSLLVLIGVGYRINTHRLKHVPESGVAMVFGFAFGIAVRVLDLPQEESVLEFKNNVFFYGLLPPIIFEAGLSLETQMFVDNLGSIAAFAVVGTLISTWVVAEMLQWAAEWNMVGLDRIPLLGMQCHLFGALISATDPVATIALFGGSRFRTDPLVHSLINGEAVLNDAVAIVLFTTLQTLPSDQEPRIVSLPILGKFFAVSAGSLAVGLASGAICSWVFCRSRFLTRFPDYEISAMVLVAYLTFAFSQLLGLSGIMALFFFGVVMAQYNWYNLSEHSKVASKVTFGTLAKLAESCVFLYLGAVAALSISRFHWHAGLVFWSMVIITIARAAHIFPISMLLNPFRVRKISTNMKVTLWISGLRGAIAFALSLRIPCSRPGAQHGDDNCRNSDLLITSTISIVSVTTLVVGTAMEKVMMALSVIEPIEPSGGLDTPMSTTPSLAAGSFSVPLASDSAGGLGSPIFGPGSPRAIRDAWHGASDAAAATSGGPPAGRLGGLPSGEASEAPLAESWGVERCDSMSLASWATGSGSRWSLRFHGRGHFYQAFARFDLNVLQPALGGPCRSRVAAARQEIVELPSLQDFLAAPGLQRGSVAPAEVEEDPPPSSRSAVFE